MSVSGGCQCGAVRFRVETGEASICHCRMCQKATGGFFGPYVEAKKGTLTWTRGEPKRFRSSNKVQRGFCGDCGTPLTFEGDSGLVGLSIGSFDDPAPLKPTVQLGSPEKLPWVDDLHAVHERQQSEAEIVKYMDGLESHQHPDHDT